MILAARLDFLNGLFLFIGTGVGGGRVCSSKISKILPMVSVHSCLVPKFRNNFHLFGTDKAACKRDISSSSTWYCRHTIHGWSLKHGWNLRVSVSLSKNSNIQGLHNKTKIVKSCKSDRSVKSPIGLTIALLCGGHTQTTIVLCLRSSSVARSMYVLAFHLISFF